MRILKDCKDCNQAIPDDSIFCELCGSQQNLVAETPANAVQLPHRAAAQAAQGLGGFWSPLSLANKLAFLGGIAAIVGFFLPWIDAPKFMDGPLSGLAPTLGNDAISSITGLTIAQNIGVLYLIPVLAITACVLLYLAIQHLQNYSRTLQASGWLVLIGALIGPVLLVDLIFIPFIQRVVGAGVWLTALGFCAIAVGGMMNIYTLSHTDM